MARATASEPMALAAAPGVAAPTSTSPPGRTSGGGAVESNLLPSSDPLHALPERHVESDSAAGGAADVGVAKDSPPAEPKATAGALDADRVEHAWKLTLESLAGMIYENAAAAERVQLSADGRLVLSFPATSAGKFARERCQRPQALVKLEGAATETFGRPVSIVLALHDAPAGAEPSPATAAAPSMKQQQADVLAQPFVQKAIELFAVDPGQVKIVMPTSEG